MARFVSKTDQAAAVVPADPAAVVAKLEEGEQIDLQELARAHTVESFGTLMRAQRSRKAPWSAKVAAANSALDYGHGRANTREKDSKIAGLTVIINQLSTGAQFESHTSAAAIASLEADVIEVEHVSGKVVVNTDDIARALEEG